MIGKLLSRLKRMPHRQRTKVTKRITDITGDHGGQSAQSLFQLMTIDEIRRLHSEYDMEIGLHTNTHPILSRMSPEEQAEEIEGCIHALRENDIPFVWIFAYPNGNPEDFDAETQAILRRSGITRALTTIDGLHDENDDPLTMKRVAIGSTCGRYEFKARLSGLFYALQRLRRR